jgi:predicted alpha/beta superfamily hydrolase
MNKTSTKFLKQSLQIVIISLTIAMCSVSSSGQGFRYSRNNPVIKDYTLKSKVLKEDRKISIWKPEVFPEYADAVPPVIYLLDGEAYINYFASMVNMLCQRFVQMPPITIVSIENYVDSISNGRERDFETADGVDRFMQFVSEELVPFVEKDYKKRPYRMIVGHSSSADLAMYEFFRQPLLFNGYLLSSPDLTEYRDIKLADSALSHLAERKNTLFISCGIEWWAQESVNRLDSFLRKNVQKGLSYQIASYPDESHYSVYLKSYYDGFKYVFKVDPAAELKNPRDMTIQIFRNHYKMAQEIFGCPVKPPQPLTAEYGTNFLTVWKDFDKALDFFKENAENYPSDPTSQIDYADAFLKKGDKQNAIMRYEKALELIPGDTELKNKIGKLKSGK